MEVWLTGPHPGRLRVPRDQRSPAPQGEKRRARRVWCGEWGCGAGAGGTEAFSAGRSLCCSRTRGRVKSFNPDSLSRNCPVVRGGRAPAGPCLEARVAVLGCRGGQARGLQPVAPRPCPASHSPWTSREAGPARGWAVRQNGAAWPPEVGTSRTPHTRGLRPRAAGSFVRGHIAGEWQSSDRTWQGQISGGQGGRGQARPGGRRPRGMAGDERVTLAGDAGGTVRGPCSSGSSSRGPAPALGVRSEAKVGRGAGNRRGRRGSRCVFRSFRKVARVPSARPAVRQEREPERAGRCPGSETAWAS